MAGLLSVLLCFSSSCATLESFKSVYDPVIDARVEELAVVIQSKPDNQALAELMESRMRVIERNPRPEILRRLDELKITPVRVPGLMYKTFKYGGADLVVMNYLLGRELPLIETDEIGVVEKNAAIIADYVRNNTKDGERVAFLSASKGSTDVYAALMNNPDIGPRVAFWIDLVGLLEGTPLTDKEMMNGVNAYRHIPRETLNSFSHEARAAISFPEKVPPETRAVHIAAFPLSKEITRAGKARFKELKPLGPNDGYILLESYTRAPGRVFLIRGADHYLRLKNKSAVQMLALVQILLDELEEEAGQGGATELSTTN